MNCCGMPCKFCKFCKFTTCGCICGVTNNRSDLIGVVWLPFGAADTCTWWPSADVIVWICWVGKKFCNCCNVITWGCCWAVAFCDCKWACWCWACAVACWFCWACCAFCCCVYKFGNKKIFVLISIIQLNFCRWLENLLTPLLGCEAATIAAFSSLPFKLKLNGESINILEMRNLRIKFFKPIIKLNRIFLRPGKRPD